MLTVGFCRHYQHLKTNPEGSWAQDDVQIDHGVNSGELVISGIYVRLFIANPGWVLRKPREFLTDLLENAINTMKSQNPDLQRLEEVTTALVKLLSAQPALAEIVPATGYISRIFSVMGGLDETGSLEEGAVFFQVLEGTGDNANLGNRQTGARHEEAAWRRCRTYLFADRGSARGCLYSQIQTGTLQGRHRTCYAAISRRPIGTRPSPP